MSTALGSVPELSPWSPLAQKGVRELKDLPKFNLKVINRYGVAGAVLQTALSFIH